MNLTFSMVAQALVFLAFIAFTIKFVWPPMLRAIESRQKTIADGLAAADQGRKSLETSAKQAAEEIQAARNRAGEIIGQAEKRAVQMIETARRLPRRKAAEKNRQRKPRSSRTFRGRAKHCASRSPHLPWRELRKSCCAK